MFLLSARGQDLYLNFEGIADGTQLSTAVLGAGAKTNGNAVTFATTITGSATGCKVVNDTAHAGLLRPVTVAGTPYTNSSPTKSLLCDSFTAGDIVEFNIGFAASKKASYGYSITLTNWGLSSVGNFYNCGGFESGGTYGVTSMVDDSPAHFQAETNSGIGTAVNVGNFTIWITGLWDSANRKYINAYYNQTNMVLLGFSSGVTVLNATVATMTFGITGSHSFTANRNYYLNNLILYTNGSVWPVWPGNNLQIPTNFTPAAVTQAISLMSAGDWCMLPGTNATWTSGITFNKNNSVLTSVIQTKYGTNQTVITADGVFDFLTVSGDYCVVSNFQAKGDGINDEAVGIVHTGLHGRYSNLYLHEFLYGFYMQNSGLMYDSVVNDCHIACRNIPGSSFYDTYFPLANDSTNQFVYEDSIFDWTSEKNVAEAAAIFSSQEGQAFTIRHCTSNLNKAGGTVAPVIDYHGDWDPGPDAFYRPGTLLQVYKYDVTIGASSISGNKFADLRGGVSYIYSNTITGANYDSDKGVVCREEHMFDDASPYVLTNTFIFNNTQPNGPMPINNPLENGGQVFPGREYTNVAPTVLVQLRYKHPMRESAAPAAPTNLRLGAKFALKLRK